MNVGEQIVSSYLRYIRRCDFIQTNLYTIESHGEIDVVGINLSEQRVYLCEVAIHLTLGLQYVKDKRPNNVNKLTEKFTRDIEYARKYLSAYTPHFMFWSPIVKSRKAESLYDQMKHIAQVAQNVKKAHQVEIEFVLNEDFQAKLREMRRYASGQTAELQCPVMRTFQIEEYLGRHVGESG